MRRSSISIRAGVVAAAALIAGCLAAAPAGHATPPAGAVSIGTTGLQGADPIPGGRSGCLISFNARDSSGGYYFLTAGRCGGTVGQVWYTDSTRTKVLGTTVAVSFPGNDYAVIKYAAGITPPGTVDKHDGTSLDITSAANAFVGEAVRSIGSTFAVHSGTVTAVNATANYPEGTVTGLIKTNVCSDAGGGNGSGAPLLDGGKAIGLLSGGSGNCSTGATTYFQPVTEPLAAYGLTVY